MSKKKDSEVGKLEDVKTMNYDIERIKTLDDFPKIKGIDFEKKTDIHKLVESMAATGFQATNLAKAVHIVKAMFREKATIFLGFTSNITTSGLREIITYLVKHKKVHAIVTTAGGVEEDIIKCLKPFVIGDFYADGKALLQSGISRTGNIFIPNDRYLYFERFMEKFFLRMYDKQKKENKIISISEFIKELGKEVNNEESYLYWAYKNDISVYCPALIYGSLGDMMFFFKQKHPDFKIDITDDLVKIEKFALHADKTGAIVLGAGMPKHHIFNSNILRGGLDYTVCINTAQEFDGSDSGARIDESITWGKVNPKGMDVKVFCDATIAFPLIMAEALSDEK
jgi:deoxyhypusine synthase